MSGAGLTITLDDAQAREVRERIRLLGRAATSEALNEIGARLVTSTQLRFETETAPDGEPWEPSGAAYERGPDSLGLGHADRGKTLQNTGRLVRSITRNVRGDEAVEVGTNVKYGPVHQFGGKTPPRTIRPRRKKALFWRGARHPVKSVRHPGSEVPARPFLGASAADMKAVAAIITRRVREHWR